MVCDNVSVDLSISTENLIELIRHLMKKYNIPINNVLRHGDTANIKCPLTITKNNKWSYIKKQIETRNNNQDDIKIDFSDFDVASNMNNTENTDSSYTSSSSSMGSVTIQLVFNDITVQESLSNANTSDNWVDMHKIKGITLHHYPPYHNCLVKEMPDYFKYYEWDRAFHYKVDYNTKIDFSKKPVSGKTTGGNDVGTSRPDVELTPGEGLYSGIIIGDGTGGTGGSDGTVVPSGTVYGWPLPGITRITSPFGPRICKFHGKETHSGIDVGAVIGTEIHAYAAGKVVKKSGPSGGYGNMVKIDHGNGCFTLYAHQNKINVNLNDTVTSGQVIGEVGNTGNSTGPHLHFELWINNERVNPVTYVKPGGGSVKIPEGFEDKDESIEARGLALFSNTRDRAEPSIVYDNIDKGTICFASAENNQHTYIERALFNNQHQKYTLSIGEFFDTQDYVPDKDATYDYPRTEKKLIEQCAKALYDEGFTSKQLWREFDLNRAPSPFLYLDRKKWILLCKEIDKQVDWLNSKYGKVTATYVPNNLLKNENTNEFIEMSPDLGVNPNGTAIVGGGSSSNTTISSIQNGIICGDSRSVMIRDNNVNDPSIEMQCEGGKAASYFYNKSKNVDRVKNWKKDASYVFVWLGINNTTAIQSMLDLLAHIKSLYNCPIYVAKELYVGPNYHYGNLYADKMNASVDEYNEKVQAFCSSNGINFVDISDGLVNGKYGNPEMMLSDHLHYNYPAGIKKSYENICKAITGSSSSTNTSTTTLKNTSLFRPVYNDTNNSDYSIATYDLSDTQADPQNVGKYCYVINETSSYIYSGPDTATNKLKTCFYGDELKIEGAQSIFYKVTYEGKTGYIRAKNVKVISTDTYGKADKKNIGKTAWIKFDNTQIYNKSFTLFNTSLDEQTECKIIDTKEGYYYIEIDDNKEGWVKAYRVTTDYSVFTQASDDMDIEPYTKVEIEVVDGDFEGNSSEDNNTSTDTDNNTNTEETKSKSTGWSELGTLEFEIIDNPKWDEEGHWNYRGDKFARIHNVSNKIAGITNDITIEDVKDKEYKIRISAWIKQVTENDYDNATEIDSLDSIMQNGISYMLLDKNNNVKYSEEIEIPKEHTKFGRKACVLSNVKAGEYKLFIGSNKNYDLFIDDIKVEQLYDIIDGFGDYIPSGNITIQGVGNTSIDNGGIMAYNVSNPSNPLALQPKINTVITQEEFEEIMANSDVKFIDSYIRQFEPYDKGLEEILDAPITQDDRLNILTERVESFTGNDIFYNVVETGPGSTDHCVKPADELNVLYKQVSVKCDPIYPDLIVPPNYSTSDYDTKNKNAIPLQALNDGSLEEGLLNKQISYDYSELEEKEKKSVGSPVNYNDPYPIDEKITDLEQHFPKVSIDEIESRLYSCNHPGCPIAQPMAKNFAMLNDAQLAQSKKIEQRLARIENILSWTIRNLGRTASRMNINCVYYGGQDIYTGKYKSIRCTHDDRIHDGISVTLDQCLCCTRYEPIIGAVYDILDETGINGSTILDDMQMSYMTLDEFKNLNKVERRSTVYNYSTVNEDDKDKVPKTLTEKWKERDKEKYKEKLKEKYSSKSEVNKELEKSIESDYIFQMDWTETEIDGQEPDVKKYPNEGIISKYFKSNGDKGESTIVESNLDETLNKDVLEDIEKYNSLVNGEWVDTREDADTTQTNKYSSEDFYFENFNKNRTGYEFDPGFSGNIGLTSSGSILGNSGSQCRSKIVEKAREIVQLHKDGKATYSNSYRTIDDTNRITIKAGDRTSYKGSEGLIGYDCSSFASCCYKYAGLESLYNKRCSDGSIMNEIVNNGGEMWLADKEGIAKAQPGDCIVCCGTSYENRTTPSANDVKNRKKITVYHIMVYLGNGEVAHASSAKPIPNAIKINTFDEKHYAFGKSIFIRPKDLIEADKISGVSGSGVTETTGTIDGHNYVCILERCVCTNYCVKGDGTNGGGTFNQ